MLAASCKDEPKQADEPLALVEAELQFAASGGSGYVKASVLNGGAITATADQSWCSVAVDGTTVAVTVTPNTSMEGRTALLTLSAAGATRSLPVSQAGAILYFSAPEVLFEGDADRKGVALKNTLQQPVNVTLQHGSTWLTIEQSGDSLLFLASASDTRLRRDTALVTLGDRTLRLPIEQLSIAGEYIATYYKYEQNTPTSEVVTLRKDPVERGVYHIDSLTGKYDYKNSIRCNYANRVLTIWGGQSLGRVAHIDPRTNELDTVRLMLMMHSPSQEGMTPSFKPSLVAPVEMDTANNLRFVFVDGYTWTTLHVEGFSTGGHDKTGRYVGRFDTYMWPELMSKGFKQ